MRACDNARDLAFVYATFVLFCHALGLGEFKRACAVSVLCRNLLEITRNVVRSAIAASAEPLVRSELGLRGEQTHGFGLV